MVLQASGQISLSDIQDEFGGSNPVNLSEYYKKSISDSSAIVPPGYPTSRINSIPTSGAISLSDFYGTELFVGNLLYDASTASVTSFSDVPLGPAASTRWLLMANAISSSGSYGAETTPPSIDGTAATMAYSITTGFADDGQRVKLSYINWPTGTTADITNIDAAGNRGGRFVLFSLYVKGTLSVHQTAYGSGSATLSGYDLNRSVNLVGGAGNQATGLVGGSYTSPLTSIDTINMGRLLVGTESSVTYTGGQLVAGVKLKIT